jgi:hypothetical protein
VSPPQRRSPCPARNRFARRALPSRPSFVKRRQIVPGHGSWPGRAVPQSGRERYRQLGHIRPIACPRLPTRHASRPGPAEAALSINESVLTCYSRRQPAMNSDVTQRGRPAGERRRARLTAAATSATARHRTVNVDGWGRGATPTRQSPLAARRPAVGENEQEGRVTGEQFRPASALALHACRHKCDGRLES